MQHDPRLNAALQQAILLESQGRSAEAETMLRQIIGLDPAHGEALHLLALLIGHGNRMEEAETYAERAVVLDPRRATFLRTQSEILRRLGKYERAEAVGRQAAALDQRDHHAPTILSAIAYQQLDLPRAIAWAQHALKRTPDHPEAHFELAKAYLIQGDFARGWVEHEWRFRIQSAAPLMPTTTQPHWDGSRLAGTLLLVADQGFGDVIQFMRYIPWAARLCGQLALATDLAVAPQVAAMHPEMQCFNLWSECPPFEAFCSLSGLPRLHGTDLATVPCRVPYLRAEPARAAEWRARLDALCPPGHRRIGLAWAGRPTHNDDANRSMPLKTLAPLAAVGGLFWVSLQKGPAREQIAGVDWPAPLLDIGLVTADFADTVAVIDGLDLVLTVDTVIAHLAGAMGKPVWLMLPYAPDWRWLLARTDSPWYSSARLFRQAAPKQWDAVVAAVADALAGA